MRWRALFALALVGCSAVLGIDDLEIGACKGSLRCLPDASTPDAKAPMQPVEAGVDGSACLSGRGPDMVRTPTGCIDGTEVTVGQYRPFFEEKGTDPSGQSPECAWNTKYLAIDSGADSLPQTGVDWCDAVAFCNWAGKKLCTPSMWLAACAPSTGVCNVMMPDAAADAAASLEAVKSNPGCVSAVPGLYDFVGNASEWTDSTFAPHDAGPDADAGGRESDDTSVSGGSYLSSSTTSCTTLTAAPRNRESPDLGFRCCTP
jgi:formylglycine-generating enzyme